MRPFAALLAMGLLFAWMESLFLDYGLLRSFAVRDYEGINPGALFLALHALSYLGAGLISLGKFPKRSSRGFPVVAAFFMLSFPWAMSEEIMGFSRVPAIAGLALAAAGSAFLFGEWAVFLSTFAPRDVAVIFGLSPLVAAFFLRLGVALDLRLLLLGAPFLGAVLFLVMEEVREEPLPMPLPQIPFWRLSLFLFCFYAANGFLLSLLPALFPLPLPRMDMASHGIRAFAALGVAFAFHHHPRDNLCNLYRGAFPLVTGAFLLFAFSPFKSLSRLFLEAGLSLLDLYAWLLLLCYASRMETRRAALIHWGLFLMISAGTLGHACLFPEEGALFSPGAFSPASLSLVGLFLLLIMLALWDGREIPLRKQEKELLPKPENLPDPQIREEEAENREEEARLRMEFVQWSLTRQETEIALLLLKGLKDMNICSLLYISRNTLKYHLRNIYRKTGVSNRRELKKLFE